MDEKAHAEIVLFDTPDGTVRLEVRLEDETVWLSLNQMANLFDRDKSVVSRHLRNIFQSGELERDSVVAKSATTAADGKRYAVEFFNLDAILSVGYRVNSTRGTQFRAWATRTLRDHVLHGYTLNESRLRQEGAAELRAAVELMARTLTTNRLVNDDGRAVLEVVKRYTSTWHLLLAYDEETLSATPRFPTDPVARLDARAARAAVHELRADLASRGESGALFGSERDDRLDGILAGLDQTFDGEPLYPSAEARAAHLFYFVIKDHPFADGNKRIASLLFPTTSDATRCCCAPMGGPAWQTAPWWRSRCS